MNRLTLIALVSSACFLFSQTGSVPADEPTEAGIAFFETKIRPLLIDKCSECHGADAQESQLRLDTPSGILTGGKSGPISQAGKPEESLLISAISHKDDALKMPPDEKLPETAIRDLIEWVKMGAPLPDAARLEAVSKSMDLEQARSHWSFQPPHTSDKSEDADVSPSTRLDSIVSQKLEPLGLERSRPASKRVLIRRAYLDLIGLPPTVEQVNQFVKDESHEAFANVVEELLESPHYGERWGRHWLDVARYADSNGLDENVAHGNAWRYRDYVIAAFNSDKPYDRFIKEQIAGDLLPVNSTNPHEQLIATAFLTLGPKVLAEGDETKMQMDIVDEQIDTLGRAFLGLTLGCARCHDHKFDPILTEDYYALAGIFQSTLTMESYKRIAKWYEHTIASPEEFAAKQAHAAKIAETETEIKTLEEAVKKSQAVATQESNSNGIAPPIDDCVSEVDSESRLNELKAALETLKANVPELPTAMGVTDAAPTNAKIHVRGSHLSLGKEVPRRTPLVLSQDDYDFGDCEQSGRLQLAEWIANSSNPLTARVWVNRVWRWHFGEGIVPTEDNFGKLGTLPTHQPLLDWLAMEFMNSGWSTKELHRTIMLSETYQQSSAFDAENAAIDPENQCLWRANVQRMDAETFRDSVLSVCDQLDESMGGSLLHVKNREFIFNHTSKDETNYDSKKRSVYLPVIRNNLYDGFSLFDYTDASVPIGDRSSSVIAPQALYALNSDLIIQAANNLAKKLVNETPDEPLRIRSLYEITLGRPPQQRELETISVALSDLQQQARIDGTGFDSKSIEMEAWTLIVQTLLISNEFLYVQ